MLTPVLAVGVVGEDVEASLVGCGGVALSGRFAGSGEDGRGGAGGGRIERPAGSGGR